MRNAVLITIFVFGALLVLSCGTEPTTNSGRVQLQNVENQPYIHINPPEDPEGDPVETVFDVSSHAGRVFSYKKRLVYENMTIVRSISDIGYYSYWWSNGKIRSYRETRSFEPFGVTSYIVVDNCIYNRYGILNNYRAIVDGMLYYFGDEFNSDTMDYSNPF